ncbi:MAG: hypothetical protein ACREA9_28930 [Pyrinomonadaceae bacterium]
MRKRMRRWALTVMIAAFLAESSLAADDPAFAKDMLATLSLLGLPCGQVVNMKRQGDSDYIVSCKDKNRYRVFVNAQGRVVAQKQ